MPTPSYVGRTDVRAGARWLNSWRSGFRLAIRDLRADPRRTVLGVTAISLPLLLIAATAVFVLSNRFSAGAMVPAEMGTGQALLRVEGPPDGSGGTVLTGENVYRPYAGGQKLALPGTAGPGRFDRSAVESLTGARLLPTGDSDVTVASRQDVVSGPAVMVGADPGYAGMATLTAGRWPTGPGEALLGGLGQAAGIPTGATVLVRDSDVPGAPARHVRIVGTARTTQPVALVEAPDAETANRWILLRDRPFGRAETLELADYGFTVASRELVTQAPTHRGTDETSRYATVTAMLTTGVVVVVAALVAPVFVVAARRGQWAIAVLASNGASAAQRRRYLLSQALLVGVIAAVVAPIAGGLAGALAVLVHRHQDPAAWAGPSVVPWTWGLLMIAVAVLSAVVAALFPAMASARRPLVSVMADDPEPAPRRAMVPFAVVTVLVACALLWRGVGTSLREDAAGGAVAITIGGLLLFAGWSMLVPPLLARLSTAAARLPVSPRIAVRDLARRRGRGAAVVGSVLATTGVLVAMLIPLASQRASRDYTYQATVPAGQILVEVSEGDPSDAEATIRRVYPAAHVAATGIAGAGNGGMTAPGRALILPAAGCHDLGGGRCASALSTADPDAGNGRGFVVTGTAADLATVYRLTEGQRSVLESGGIVVSRQVAAAMGLTGGSGQTTVWSAPAGGGPGASPTVGREPVGKEPVGRERTRSTRVVVAGPDGLTLAPRNPHTSEPYAQLNVGALVPSTQVEALGVTADLTDLLVSRPGGFDGADQDRLRAAFGGTAGVDLGISGSPQEGPSVPLVAGAGFVLVLLAVATGTMLVQADRRRDAETFRRLGAGDGVRRSINAWYAATAAAIGAVAGCLAGTVPGVAMALEARSRAEVFAVPWSAIAVLILGAPVAAAALAALTTRDAAGFRSSRNGLR